MITITVKKRNGNYLEFVSKGHAGYAEEGQDIVCSAVSALVINFLNSFEQLTEDAGTCRTSEDDAVIEFRVSGTCSEEGQILLDSLVLGITNIESEYRPYIHVVFEEV